MSGSLRGAFLLARGRPEGLAWIAAGPAGPAGALRAMWLCLPAFLCLRLMVTPDIPGTRALIADIAAFLGGWAGFLLAARGLLAALDQQRDWPLYAAAWSWAGVPQYLVVMAGESPSWLGLTGPLPAAAAIVAFLWSVWIAWFVARTALPGGPLAPLLLVALDIAIALFTRGLAESMTG